MGLICKIIKFLSDSKETKEKTLKECKDAGLEDWQTQLVMKGENDIHNFEEEDLEDDDYFNEDE